LKHSTDRILTTHIGSLPRPDDLLELVWARARGEAVDEAAYQARLKDAIADLVRKQVDCGLDIVADGEFSKPSFLSYINERLAGFERSEPEQGAAGSPWMTSREGRDFPEYYESQSRGTPNPAMLSARSVCTSAISYTGHELLAVDIANLRAAMDAAGAEEGFMPSISPSNAAGWNTNEYYATDEEYLFAVAEALREEYEAIVEAGFLLQVDDPALVSYYALNPDVDLDEARRWAEVRVEALNHALRNIPSEKVRFHTCYSINIGPRVHDMELKDIVDVMLRIRAGAFSFEAGNPRHDHEWRVWGNVRVPDGVVLIPGVITHSSVLVEHPQLVADRLLNFAGIVGRENVIAGADCGFATFAGNDEIHPNIVWAKLASLVEGARLATSQLW
jgi:5-methyltetrahydropteroyltriglutamate--homocysteine methyltransferase